MKLLAAHTVLAIGALVLAATMRQRDAGPSEGAALTRCDEVSAIRWTAGPRTVRVFAAEAGPQVQIDDEEGQRTFPGGRAAADLLDQMRELRATRSLNGGAEPELGASATLAVRCAGSETVLAVGSETPGSQGRYLRDAEERIHVVDATPLRRLAEAEVFLGRRRLHPFEESAVESIAIHGPTGSHQTLLQRFGDDPRRRRWVDPAAPEVRQPRLDRLMGAHRSLRAQRPMEPPAEGEPLGTMVFRRGDTTLGELELVRVGRGPGARHFVRTDHAGWVLLPSATGAAFAEAVAAALEP